LTGGWCPAAVCRPLCADLAQNASERAQIVAAWVLLEKTSSSIFGAPLVGYLSKRMFNRNLEVTRPEMAGILARNIFMLSTFFWGICAFFFFLMGRAEKDRKNIISAGKRNEEAKAGNLSNAYDNVL